MLFIWILQRTSSADSAEPLDTETNIISKGKWEVRLHCDHSAYGFQLGETQKIADEVARRKEKCRLDFFFNGRGRPNCKKKIYHHNVEKPATIGENNANKQKDSNIKIQSEFFFS